MRIDIPAAKKLVHQMSILMRWGDLDAMGHLNNCNYFRYLETARFEWLRSIGFDAGARDETLVVASAFFNFHRQLEYPAEVLLKMYVSDPGRTTFETWATLERVAEPGVVCAAGGATLIWIDLGHHKAAPLPAWLREIVSNDAASRKQGPG